MIDDPSVSKIHASLVVDADGQLSVADTGSTNGTFINDQRISYGKATRLVEGDRVKFGVVEVVFEHVPRPAVVETEESTEEAADDEAVAIDGFEFKRKVSPDVSEDSAPAIPIPDETAKIEPEANENHRTKKDRNCLVRRKPTKKPKLTISHNR